MGKKFLILATLPLLLLLSGCTGPSIREVGQIGFVASLGVMLVMTVLTLLLSRITKTKKLYWQDIKTQFVVLIVISVWLSVVFALSSEGSAELGEVGVALSIGQVIVGMLAMPYLLLFITAFLAFLPKERSKYIPSIIMGIYWLDMLVKVTLGGNYQRANILGITSPVLLPISLFFIAIPLFIILILYIIIKKV